MSYAPGHKTQTDTLEQFLTLSACSKMRVALFRQSYNEEAKVFSICCLSNGMALAGLPTYQ